MASSRPTSCASHDSPVAMQIPQHAGPVREGQDNPATVTFSECFRGGKRWRNRGCPCVRFARCRGSRPRRSSVTDRSPPWWARRVPQCGSACAGSRRSPWANVHLHHLRRRRSKAQWPASRFRNIPDLFEALNNLEKAATSESAIQPLLPTTLSHCHSDHQSVQHSEPLLPQFAALGKPHCLGSQRKEWPT
jgi:hypothetical protein